MTTSVPEVKMREPEYPGIYMLIWIEGFGILNRVSYLATRTLGLTKSLEF